MSSVVTFEPGNHSKSLGKRIDEHLYHIYIITYQRSRLLKHIKNVPLLPEFLKSCLKKLDIINYRTFVFPRKSDNIYIYVQMVLRRNNFGGWFWTSFSIFFNKKQTNNLTPKLINFLLKQRL